MKVSRLTLFMFGMVGCIQDATTNDESTAAAIDGSQIPPPKDAQSLTQGSAGTVRPLAWSNCPAGFSCYWDLPNAIGVPSLGPGPGWVYLGNMRDRISAVWNRGGGAVDFYNCVDLACSAMNYMTTVGIGVSRNLDAFEDKADYVFIHH